MNITRGKIESAQKVVIYGPEGIGKSTFASQFPDPLFIDTEGSTKQLDVARMDPPSSWTMLMAQVDYVIANPNVCKTLIIDTADWAEKLAIEFIANKHRVNSIGDIAYGNGYTYLEEEFGRFLNKLTELVRRGIHAVLTAHSKITKFERPDEMGAYDRWELKLQKKTSPLLKEWADMVLFANYKTQVVNVDNQGAVKGKNKAQGARRMMYTNHTPSWDAKNRHGLPEEIDFAYSSIAHIFTKKAPEVVATKAEATPQAVENEKSNIATKDMYFLQVESNAVFRISPGEEIPTAAEGVKEISEAEYRKIEQADLQIVNEELERIKDMFSEADQKNVSSRAYELKEANNKLTWAKAFEMAQAEMKMTAPVTEELQVAKEEVKTPEQVTMEQPKLVENKALNDLMLINNVTREEIQKVVGDKGYYPADTPIENYDPSFVYGVLIGAWQQVFGMIQESRK